MEVILQQDLDELGLEGDIVKVAKGYARNYLIPKGIALEAISRNIKALEQKRKKIEINRLKAKESAEQVKQQLEAIDITITHKAGEGGKLYGSVTSMDIAAFLESKGIIINRKKIILEKPIKEIGEFKASVKIYPEVTGEVKVIVVSGKEKEE